MSTRTPAPARDTGAVAPVSGGLRQGADRCPGAVRLHDANDGHVARIRIPGGRLSAAQLRVILSAATDLGDGDIHLTSRANLQLRGLAADAGQRLADRLFAAGLLPSVERDRVRNVVASPRTGLDGPGPAGFERVVADLDRLLCETPGLEELSGRFLFAVDDGHGDVAGLGPDLAAVAQPGGGFRLSVGGRPTTVVRPVDQTASALVETALRFLDLARPGGAWRVLDLDEAALVSILPLASQPAQGSVPSHPDSRARSPRALGTVMDEGVVAGIQVLPRLGSATARQWAAVAEVADRAHDLDRPVRLTPWRSVVVGRLGAAESAKALTALRDNGFETEDSSPWVRVSACIGRPGCASALSDVRAEAQRRAAGDTNASPVHVSGCGRRCGRPAGPHQSVVAVGEGAYETTIEES